MFKKVKVDLLIAQVFDRKPLWDQRSPYHHNRTVLDRLWDQVAEEVGCTRDNARSKWKCLKDQMRKELRKEELQDENDPYRSAWRYYNKLYFIKNQLETRRHLEDPLDIRSPDEGSCSTNVEPSTTIISPKRIKHDVQFEQRFLVENDQPEEEDRNVSYDGDDYHFLMSLLPYMKQFDSMTKMKVRMDIQEVILKRTMGCLNNSEQNGNN